MTSPGKGKGKCFYLASCLSVYPCMRVCSCSLFTPDKAVCPCCVLCTCMFIHVCVYTSLLPCWLTAFSRFISPNCTDSFLLLSCVLSHTTPLTHSTPFLTLFVTIFTVLFNFCELKLLTHPSHPNIRSALPSFSRLPLQHIPPLLHCLDWIKS